MIEADNWFPSYLRILSFNIITGLLRFSSWFWAFEVVPSCNLHEINLRKLRLNRSQFVTYNSSNYSPNKGSQYRGVDVKVPQVIKRQESLPCCREGYPVILGILHKFCWLSSPVCGISHTRIQEPLKMRSHCWHETLNLWKTRDHLMQRRELLN